MAELTIRPEEIRDALDNFVQSYEPGAASREEVGRVIDAGDGIAHVEGLPSAMTNELLKFADDTLGIALNLEAHQIGVVLLGDFSGIEEGQEVKRTGEVLSVPVGDNFLGRVVNPLGQPIDGLGEIVAEARRALELQAPGPSAAGSVSSSSVTARPERPRLRSTRSSTRRPTGRPVTRPSRFAASMSASARRARPSRPCEASSKRPARWNTPRSSRPRPQTRLASSTSPHTPARPSASIGCTPASTS